MKYYLAFAIPASIALMIVLAIYVFLGGNTWQNFLPNFLATILGAIIGIPIAIGINNHLQQTAEKERWAKILPLLREELFVNLTQLSGWQKSQNPRIETVYTDTFLETGSWDVFSNNGALTSVRDPKLLNQLSRAYSSIRIVRQLTERYMDLVHLSHESERKLLLTLVEGLIRKGVDNAVEEISAALRVL